MKRKHKIYSRPKRPFDKVRIDEEAKIKKEYGLKNKREIWKAESKIKTMREKAKKLIGKSEEEQKVLFERLNKLGMGVHSISDILALDKKNYLERRLQTVVFKKKLAKSVNEARQLISHKKVLIDGKAVNSPSYIVPIGLENKISLKAKKVKAKKIEEKIPEETNEEVKEQETESHSPAEETLDERKTEEKIE